MVLYRHCVFQEIYQKLVSSIYEVKYDNWIGAMPTAIATLYSVYLYVNAWLLTITSQHPSSIIDREGNLQTTQGFIVVEWIIDTYH